MGKTPDITDTDKSDLLHEYQLKAHTHNNTLVCACTKKKNPLF